MCRNDSFFHCIFKLKERCPLLWHLPALFFKRQQLLLKVEKAAHKQNCWAEWLEEKLLKPNIMWLHVSTWCHWVFLWAVLYWSLVYHTHINISHAIQVVYLPFSVAFQQDVQNINSLKVTVYEKYNKTNMNQFILNAGNLILNYFCSQPASIHYYLDPVSTVQGQRGPKNTLTGVSRKLVRWGPLITLERDTTIKSPAWVSTFIQGAIGPPVLLWWQPVFLSSQVRGWVHHAQVTCPSQKQMKQNNLTPRINF